MRKFPTFLFLLLCITGTVFAQGIPTKDYLRIASNQNFVPGVFDEDNDYFDVELVGSNEESQLYTCIQMDIILPEGVSLYSDSEADWIDLNISDPIYPFAKSGKSTTYFHSLVHSYGLIGKNVLRVSVKSDINKEFAGRSGSLFYVYLNTTAYAKPGTIELRLENVKFILPDETYYVPENQPTQTITIEGNSHATLTVSSTNHWSTCILPFAAEIPTGVKAYTVGSHDSDNLLLSEANSFAAYTPYILYSESGYSGNVSGTVDPAQYPATGVVNTDGYLNGAIVAQNVTSGYVMQNLSEGVKFYQITSGTFNVPAGKCWMTLPAGGHVKGLGFVVEDESAIEQIKTPESHIIYNLAGQQVQNPQKGIYIVNGKKVMY